MKKILKAVSITVVLVAVMVASVATTPKAEAATIAELQAQVAVLMEQVAKLQALLAAKNSGVELPKITLTRTLSYGMSGEDVRELQSFLNADLATQVATYGPGSRGYETTYFGPATQAAVIKFQNKYRTHLLTPYGLTQGNGYVGPSTLAFINNISSGPVKLDTGDKTTTPEKPTGEEGDITVTRGGEHTSTLELGTTDDIYSLDIKAHDSDMTINRVDFIFNERPWRYLDSFMLYLGDDRVAKIDAEEKNFSESGNEYKLRFSNLDAVIEEGEKETLTLKAKALSSLSSSREDDSLTIYVPRNGVRSTDTINLTSYGPSSDLTARTFDFRSTENDGSLVVTRSSDSPKTGLLEVSDRNDTDAEVLVAKVKAKANDITLKKAYVLASSSESEVSEVASKLSLMSDGEKVQTVHITQNTGADITGKDEDGNTYVIIPSGNYYAYFDDIDSITINEGEYENISFEAEFGKVVYDYPVNTTINFALRHVLGENESDEDVVNGDLTVGDNQTFTLNKDGITFEMDDYSTSLSGKNNTIGNYALTFDITPFGDDVYLPRTAEKNTGTSTSGTASIEYSIRTNDGTIYTEGSTVANLTVRGAAKVDSFFKLIEDETYAVVLETTLNNTGATAGSYRVQIDAINYRIGETAAAVNTVTSDFQDFETKGLFLND